MEAIFGNITNNASSWYIAILIIILTIIYYVYNSRSLPPGPTGLPYIGYWPFLKKSSPHLQLHELGKKYGGVFSFNITGQLYINLGSHKAVREAVITKANCFAERPQFFTVGNMCLGDGVLFLNGEKWKTNRKFFSQQFRGSGMNTVKIESGSIYDAVRSTIDDLYKSKGEPVELVSMLTEKCTNVMYTTIFGETGITLADIRAVNDADRQTFSSVFSVNFFLAGNIVRYLILPLTPAYWTVMKYFNILKNKLCELIDHHKETFDETHIRNLIDAYFNEKKTRESKNDPSAEYFTDKLLMSTLIQIIGDGVGTVAIGISSAFQALLDHPEEQGKIYKELIEVIGSGRNPSLEDKNNLPYTHAFITEVLRMTDVLPFFPDMVCTKETTVGGYRIPKGALTVRNIWSCHYDSKVYEDPEKFNPSRFLPTEEKKKEEQPIIFGLGKRSCLGEGYTMSQLFLFLTTIVKHFRLSKPKDSENEGLLFFKGTMHACARPRTNQMMD